VGEASVALVAGVICRIPRRALLKFAVVSAASSLTIGVWASVASATQFTTSAANAKVSQTQAQVTQIEKTIAQEQQRSAVLTQEYDAAVGHVQTLRAQLAVTAQHIAATKRTIVVDKRTLAKAAVQAYVLGAQGAQITSLFATSANTAVVSQEYSDTAIGNLSTAKAALQAAEAKLNATEQQQQVEEQRAQVAVQQVQTLQLQNEQAAAQAQDTLTSIKGQLATEVAQAAQAKAAREAAAAAAAAALKKQQEAEQAAAQAQLDAELVTSLGGTAGAATASANQASSSAGGPSVGYSGTSTVEGAAAVRAAESQLGVPYVWGGETPGVGFDCSGLTQWSWRQAGVSIPRTATSQYWAVPHVSLSALEPGDLLFYSNLDPTQPGIDHVAMYVGSGTLIQAPFTGTVVREVPLYTTGLVGAGRP
jgi:cell wall-associated NlpC family hydrolase